MRKFLILVVALLFAATVEAAEFKRYLEIPLKSAVTTYSEVMRKPSPYTLDTVWSGHNAYPYWEYTATSPAIVWPRMNPNNQQPNPATGLTENYPRGNALTAYNISPILVTFRVPSDYKGKGEWILTFARDSGRQAATTDKTVAVDYDYWQNAENVLWTETVTNNAPEWLAGYSEAYIDYVTLTAPTALVANRQCTLRIWRHNFGNDYRDLRLFDPIIFSYQPRF